MKIRKLSEKAKTPEIVNGVIKLYSTKITTEVGEDAKLVIVYHTDLAMNIPENHVAILMPLDDIYKKSIAQTNSISVLNSKDIEKEIVVRFKTNTDVVPSVYKAEELFAQMIILPMYDIKQLEVEEFTSTVEEDQAAHNTTEE